MCIITTEEAEADLQRWLDISKTNIFARHTRPGHQAIVYSLSIASSSRAAMILPLPIAADSPEDALRFIDLSGYPDFFDDLALACTNEYQQLSEDFECGNAAAASLLQVHQVGDYEASYVPSMADFDRLAPCFRLPPQVWQQMPAYADYGFAVFQLKLTLSGAADRTDNAVHPMAFEFPTRDPERLFFPSVHVHDGHYHQQANFYHRFYCQRDGARTEFKRQRDRLQGLPPTPPEPEPGKDDGATGFFLGYDWYYASANVACKHLKIDQCQGIVAPDRRISAMSLLGPWPNRDLWLGED